MCDLKADLKWLEKIRKPLFGPKRYAFRRRVEHMIGEKAFEGWPHAIERAIKAESLVRELVGALAIGLYGSGNRSLEERGLVLRRSYDKTKEVLGDGAV